MHSYGEKKKNREDWQRMDSKGGGGAVCQCVYRRKRWSHGGSKNREIGDKNRNSGERGDEIGTVV